ncbi:MAG TPA: ABC transporter ATP-binding protein [Casimicrobiaceae bacterium]|jgi:NitT/TauT family transport system ATP-binding protein/sulfonate transport system ATP-binding protein|nr:ABC transporter ATP-binding protein [Casimicrobiaceae bacterium]
MADKIVVRDVSKSYPTDHGALPVLRGIDFTVGNGEFVAIVGPSGCGKTTLLQMIAGFDPPDTGKITVDGATQSRPSPKGILISQKGSVFPWLTVQRNLMFGLNRQRNKVELSHHYAGLVGLKGFERSYPHELSGGMLKRLELARALVVKPDILYMDEPLAALDALTNLQMRLELRRILEIERHTCVLITHDVEEAIHLAHRILVLSPRPATIQARFEVPFPHPRHLGDPRMVELKTAILREFGLED